MYPVLVVLPVVVYILSAWSTRFLYFKLPPLNISTTQVPTLRTKSRGNREDILKSGLLPCGDYMRYNKYILENRIAYLGILCGSKRKQALLDNIS